jgi:hypothetical protein
MMDFLGILNDATMMKLLSKDEEALEKAKADLNSGAEVRSETKIGHYSIYLSLYEIIEKYKYQSMPSASISETVRFLHGLFSFYIFGDLAINSENNSQGQTFKVVFLWLFILSIYLNAFELDLSIMENSSGPFLEPKLPSAPS